MPGDSDKDFFDLDGEERAEGEEEIPTSPQELLQELQRERAWQQTQSPAVDPTEYALPEPLSEDNALEGDAASTFSTSALPPWPTRSSSAARSFSSAAGGPPTAPMANPGQPLGDDLFPSFPPPAAAPSRGSAQQKGVPPLPHRNRMRVASPAGGAFPAWSSFRKRSPWLIPLIFVFFFFALVLLVKPTLALPLLFIFAAIGVLEVAALLYVPSDAFWVVGVVASFVLMMAVAFFAFFTPIFATALSVLLVALGIVAIRERYHPVKEGTVAVMGLFEKYNRILQPGFNLRVPGEKVLGIVSTHRERYQIRIPSLTLATGEHIALDVAMSYQIIPGQEYLAIRDAHNWKEPLQQLLVEVTQDVVSGLSADDFFRQHGSHPSPGGAGGALSDSLDDEYEQSPLSRINDRLTQEMRAQVADRGVGVHVVKIRLESPLAPGRVSAPGPAPAPVSPGIFTHPTSILPSAGQGIAPSADNVRPAGGPATRPLSPLYADERGDALPPTETLPTVVFPGQALPVPSAPMMPITPPPRGGIAPVAPVPTPPPLLSLQALKETYDAVMRRRITGIDTIRRVVMQFEAVAKDPVLSEQVDFDAAKAAQHLRNHLSILEAQSRTQLSSSPSEDGSAPSDPQMPSEPEEE